MKVLLKIILLLLTTIIANQIFVSGTVQASPYDDAYLQNFENISIPSGMQPDKPLYDSEYTDNNAFIPDSPAEAVNNPGLLSLQNDPDSTPAPAPTPVFTLAPAADFILENATGTILKYNGSGGNIEIPSKINNITVLSIASSAFQNNGVITGVSIPESVTSIKKGAFYHCSSLTVTMIPKSVTIIEDLAFANCNALTDINVDSGNPNYSSENSVLFNKSKTTIVQYPGGIHVSYTIPGSVTKIGIYAFYQCVNLTNVTIPDSVTGIESYAFYQSGLPTVEIPGSVTVIESKAFANCSALTDINVDSGNPNYSSENGVLFNKNKTTIVQYPGGIQGSYTIPDSVAEIGSYAFYQCYNLTGITIPNSTTSIDDYAFYQCNGLTTVEIPGSVTGIGDRAFYNCSSLASVTIPDSVTSIAEGAFASCGALTGINVDPGNAYYSSENGVLFNKSKTTIVQYPGGIQGAYTIPSSVTKIEDYSFYQCYNLTNVTIPNSVTSIDGYAFYQCTGLTAVEIPVSVKTIMDAAFYQCGGLTRVTMGGVVDIRIWAFNSCYKLLDVTFPNSLTTIGNYAFLDCTSLKNAYFLGNAPSMGSYVFYNATTGFTVRVKQTATGFSTPTWKGYPCQIYNYSLPIAIDSLILTDTDGTALSSVSKGQTVRVESGISGPAVGGKLIIAMYNQKKLFMFKNMDYTISGSYNTEITLPQDLEELSVKVFALENLTSTRPVSNTKKLLLGVNAGGQ